MNISFRTSLIFFVLMMVTLACSQNTEKNSSSGAQNIISLEGVAMTIPYHMEIVRINSSTKESDLQAIANAVFDEVNTIYNKWNPNSELSMINDLPAYEPKVISPELAKFLKRVEIFVELSDGRFDPTIEPVQKLWKAHLEKGTVPSKKEIEALRPCIGWDKIVLNGTVIMKKHNKVAIDLGAIAKGYAVDLLAEAFYKKGYKNIFIEWGGEVRVMGMRPLGRKWAVYIPNLEDLNPEHALAYVPLSNQSIATSGDYLQQWTIKEKENEVTYMHIINPKTLQPLVVTSESIASASCLAHDCATADAIATCLLACQSIDEAKALSENFQTIFPETSFWILSHKDMPAMGR